jgi:hypothetical protein
MYIELSQATKDICKQNYKSNCGNCPIRPECISSFGHGVEGYNKSVKAINDAAERIEKQ